MKQDLRQHKFWQINSTSQLSSHFTPPLTFCFVLFCLFQTDITRQRSAHGRHHILLYIQNPKCCNFHFLPQDSPEWNAWPCVCTQWEACQHLLCLYTSAPLAEMIWVHLQTWTAPSRKLNIPIQNHSHLKYRLFLCMSVVWPLSSRLPAAQTELMTQLKRCQKNPDKQTKKKKGITEVIKQLLIHLIAWENKFAANYAMHSCALTYL